jgi:endonuclease/exonuclease/phosphatase family metal-dependent hydrolase
MAMPYYADLNMEAPSAGHEWQADPPARTRVVERLRALREGLNDPTRGAPPSRAFGSLILATWNLREFDSPTWGERLPETFAYIAEIIDRFDLVAIQEVRDDLRALERLRDRLGRHWEYLVSDVTAGRPGNNERLAFLYDTRKVHFLGMAGELVLPPITVEGKTVPASQIARTPLMAAFQVGWTQFVLTTVHIIYGDGSAAPPERVKEIEQIAGFLHERAQAPTEPVHNFILLGDFNIFSAEDPTMDALVHGGEFTIPDGIRQIPGSNVPKNKKYDQIAYLSRPDRFEATGAAGVFDFYEIVFRRDDEALYRPYIDAYVDQCNAEGQSSPSKPIDDAGRQNQYETWRTYQMSDHLPLWTEFKADFSDQYLAKLAG